MLYLYHHKHIRWNELKNKRLKQTRGVSFKELLDAKLIAIKQHPHRQNQRLLLFEYGRYIWIIPFIETESELFLKTLFPSRKYTEIYKKEIGK